ncbi:hypothetical protein CCPUN_07450 [Cardinium endosymbiont of Culicoides punctatus]|nr:hypothetical protein CCPUN_07450 [Cardinium endosymbiont of Culicoides punctatus]
MIFKNNKKNYAILLCLVLSLFSCKEHKHIMEMRGIKRKPDNMALEHFVKKRNDLLPIGNASIRKILASGIYSDKTKFIGSLLMSTEGQSKFLIRPRRFGKSTLISTIATIAEGTVNKALFEGCYIHSNKFECWNLTLGTIENKAYNWKKYPIIRLDFSNLSKSVKLEEDIKKDLYGIAEKYGIESNMQNPEEEASMESYYKDLVNKLIKKFTDLQKQEFEDRKMEKANKSQEQEQAFIKFQEQESAYSNQVIVLIDEYDGAVVNLDWNSSKYKNGMTILGDFFRVVKSRAEDCKLVFVTGVTNFTLSDIGSGPNNFEDISLYEEVFDITGYTEKDIRELFAYELEYICQERNKRIPIEQSIEQQSTNKEKNREVPVKQSVDTVMNDLKDYYNGYKFFEKDLNRTEPNTIRKDFSVFNPTSILYYFKQEGKLKNYWYRTGDPSILLEQMNKHIEKFMVDWDDLKFEATEEELLFTKQKKDIDLIPLMFQTGYLTIDSCENDMYTLKFPNEEIKQSLLKNIEEAALARQEEDGKAYSGIFDTLKNENWNEFLLTLYNNCFTNAGYIFLNDTEKSFHAAIHLFLVGACHNIPTINVSSEKISGSGRSDIIINDTKNHIAYIIELKKSNQSSDVAVDEALNQIASRNYDKNQYKSHKKIVHIGLNCIFDIRKIKNKHPNHRNIDACCILVKRKKGRSQSFSVENKRYFEHQGEEFVWSNRIPTRRIGA